MWVTFQEVVGGARELPCAYVRALTIVQMCQKFHCAQKLAEIFSSTSCIGKKFLLVKISAYTVLDVVNKLFPHHPGHYLCLVCPRNR